MLELACTELYEELAWISVGIASTDQFTELTSL